MNWIKILSKFSKNQQQRSSEEEEEEVEKKAAQQLVIPLRLFWADHRDKEKFNGGGAREWEKITRRSPRSRGLAAITENKQRQSRAFCCGFRALLMEFRGEIESRWTVICQIINDIPLG